MSITWRAVAAVGLGFIPVILRPVPSTVGLWLVLVLGLTLLDVWLAPSPQRLTIDRTSPVPVRVGESTEASLSVTNTGKRKLTITLRDAWQPSAGASDNRFSAKLEPKDHVTFTTQLQPQRRGDRLADRVTVRSFGPLGLASRQMSFECPGVVRGLPAFPSRKHLPSRLSKLQQIEGRATVRTRGQGTEFDSLRDYVEGDDVRAIDWRSTARRQHLVVRTWRPERDRRILMVLDTSRMSAARVGDVPRLDYMMDAALLLGTLATKAGDLVGLIAGDREVRSGVLATRTDALARLSEAMSLVEPAIVEADWTELAAAIQQRGHRQSLLVLLTPLEPAAVGETLLPVLAKLASKHRVVLASVADPELDQLQSQRDSLDNIYAAAAAEFTYSQRQRTAEALEQIGITVIDVAPPELPVKLADHYLMLKSRGLL